MLEKSSSLQPTTNSPGTSSVSWLDIFVDLSFALSLASLGDIFSAGVSWTSLGIFSMLAYVVLWVWNRLSWYTIFSSTKAFWIWLVYAAAIFAMLAIATNTSLLQQGVYKFASYWFLVADVALLVLWAGMLRRQKRQHINTLPNFIAYFVSFWLIFASLFAKGDTRIALWVIALLLLLIIPYIGWLIDRKKIPLRSSAIVSRQFLFATVAIGLSLFPMIDDLRSIYTFSEIGVAALCLLVVVLLVRIFQNNIVEFRMAPCSAYSSFKYVYALNLVYIPLMGGLAAMIHGYSAFLNHTYASLPSLILLMMVGLGVFVLVLGVLPQAFLHGAQHSRTAARLIVGAALTVSAVVISRTSFLEPLLITAALLLVLVIAEIIIGRIDPIRPSVGPVVGDE